MLFIIAYIVIFTSFVRTRHGEPKHTTMLPHALAFLFILWMMRSSPHSPLLNERVYLIGAKLKLMTANQIEEKFAWINTNGIELGVYGLENEGWMDPWSLLQAFRVKNKANNVRYVDGEVIGFQSEWSDQARKVVTPIVDVRLPNGDIQPVEFSSCIICAGAESGRIARMAGFGAPESEGEKALGIPVEPRKRYAYVCHIPDGPGLEMPFVVDNSGAYVRREGLGGHYLCGASPFPDEEPTDMDLENVDEDFFHERVWPLLAHRIPCFEKLKMTSSWAGYYDYNTVDQNLIIGYHPADINFLFATGLSGHGLQHSIGVGRAISELVFGPTHHYESIDLTRFQVNRFGSEGELLNETAIV